MRVIVFTSNALRHRFVANSLLNDVADGLIVCETKKSDALDETVLRRPLEPIEEHFRQRYETEREFFDDHATLMHETLPIQYKEANLSSTAEIVEGFRPDAAFVFGASIIGQRLIDIVPAGRFVNLHLGLSPYYRGSGTNFWPFVNDELQYVGATIHHLDPGIDTGQIISHAVPNIEAGDDVHRVGCKVIQAAVEVLKRVLDLIESGTELPRVPQWEVPNEKYYRAADFDEGVLERYRELMAGGLVERYLAQGPEPLRLVGLPDHR